MCLYTNSRLHESAAVKEGETHAGTDGTFDAPLHPTPYPRGTGSHRGSRLPVVPQPRNRKRHLFAVGMSVSLALLACTALAGARSRQAGAGTVQTTGRPDSRVVAGSIAVPIGYAGSAYTVGPRNAWDTLQRSVRDGFGTAVQGGTYRTTPATAFSVSPGVGAIAAMPSGNAATATLSSTHVLNEQFSADFSAPELPGAGGGVYFGIELRKQANGDSYRVRARIAPYGVITLDAVQVIGGVEQSISRPVTLAQRLQPRKPMTLQGFITGSGTAKVNIKARAWAVGTRSPSWQLTMLQSANKNTRPGALGLWTYTSGNSAGRALRITQVSGNALVRTGLPGPAPTVVAPSGQPNSKNTGVPPGTVLKNVYGNLKVTTPGATLSGLDIHGFVIVEAPNVTIRDSIVRGGVAHGNIGLVNDIDASATNLMVQDSELVPQHPSVWIDGIKGGNYTALRVNIHGTVDGAKAYGNNVTIRNSWIHDTVYFAHDPNQGNRPSHNDGVQVLSGRNVRIYGSTIQGGGNAALQVTQGHGRVSDFSFNGNWVGGGACTLNIAVSPMPSMDRVTLDGNHFYRTSKYKCPMIIDTTVSYSATGNKYIDNSAPAPVQPRKP